jgi:Family of unknown function (DUF5719)
MSPPRHSARAAHASHVRPEAGRRWLILLLVVAVLGGVAYAAHKPGVAEPGGPPVSPAALVTSDHAESSAWYCTGQTTVSGALAPGTVMLTNTTGRAVTGTITSDTDTAATTATNVVVPARQQVVANLAPPASGTWSSDTVILNGGGVAVSQAIKGPNGWSEAPCESSTSQHWYFPSGTSTGTNGLFIALFNPTSTPDVIDLSFTTPTGVVHPINFEGIVLQPNQTQVENVSLYVQNEAAVATTVTTRTGRVVASEMQVLTVASNANGLAIIAGSPRPERQWVIPESLELPGGTSSIDIFNPGSQTEDVTLRMQLASGSLTPFSNRLLPGTTWTVVTSSETRIPDGDVYDAVVTSTGGPGVVVGRSVAAPATAPAPQVGITTAVDTLTQSSPAHIWVVPSPGTTATPALPGVLPAHLSMVNSTDQVQTYRVAVLSKGGVQTIAEGSLKSHAFITLSASTLLSAGLNSLLISASGPLAIAEDVGPTGTIGVVTMPAIPLS